MCPPGVDVPIRHTEVPGERRCRNRFAALLLRPCAIMAQLRSTDFSPSPKRLKTGSTFIHGLKSVLLAFVECRSIARNTYRCWQTK
jgi:hypothetical protein